MVTYRMTNVGEFTPYFSVVVGDVIHNLRSALDHLAWQLVILDGGQPNDSTQFPIYESATNAGGNPRNVTIQPGIRDQRIIDALIAAQPFDRGRSTGTIPPPMSSGSSTGSTSSTSTACS